MPQIYSDYHDKFIENHVNSMENKGLITDRMIMLKLKNNYVIPAYITVKVNKNYF